MRTLLGMLVVAGAVAGCKPADELKDKLEDRCEGLEGAPTVTVTSHGGSGLVHADLLVRGTAAHPKSVAIRTIFVAGVPATNERFNFGSWSVTVPLDTLEGGRESETDEVVTVPVEVMDACGETATATFDVRLGVPASELDLQPDYPGEETFVPANSTTPMALLVSAAATSAGARVHLKTTEGATLLGADEGVVTLSGDGSARAEATVLLTANGAGVAVVTASADAETKALPVKVAGPPSLLPSSASLAPGQVLAVTVDTDGRVEACQATPAAGITVTSGGTNLMATPAAVDDTNDGKPDIIITVDAALAAPVTFQILCQDPFGQSTTGSFTAAP